MWTNFIYCCIIIADKERITLVEISQYKRLAALHKQVNKTDAKCFKFFCSSEPQADSHVFWLEAFCLGELNWNF